jgi:hypothetical protein
LDLQIAQAVAANHYHAGWRHRDGAGGHKLNRENAGQVVIVDRRLAVGLGAGKGQDDNSSIIFRRRYARAGSRFVDSASSHDGALGSPIKEGNSFAEGIRWR